MSEELDKVYDPKKSQKWYEVWEEQKLFHAEIDPSTEPYVIMIPPPNVTGSLHMGHAVNNTMQDVLIRHKRMQGNVVLWVPGTDHAGIATQNVVEKQLYSEGKSRHDLGREEFIKRVWQWKEKYGSTIIGQLKTLGCSCDWQRERFTMDEGYSKAVKKVFVELYDQKLIYRSNRIINWCPRCVTALSDIEVEHHDKEGALWYIRYPIKKDRDSSSQAPQNDVLDGDSSSQAPQNDKYIIVATTRPETMLGDTAVAVNPTDKRYTHLIGKTVVLPLTNREIPIIGDEFVDPAFGTGAVKVTPAHDPNDFEIGQRHNLESIKILDDQAKITNVSRYDGMDRFDARRQVLKDLEAEGLLEKTELHSHSVGHCYRCHTVVEPYLSLQWFVDMKPLAAPAIDAVKSGDVKFQPARWSKLYFTWMDNIKDWCISRQIWWGHQIPAWYCAGQTQNPKLKTQNVEDLNGCDEVIVSVEKPNKCPKCGSTNMTQDNDVLDTWFSSALWPFATLGWPDDTDDLGYFYPTSVLVTARDILYFWVARMIMTGLKFKNAIPFHTVVINPTVLNWEGKRMSKSLGTGLDPLDYIDIYGSDALRFGLMYQVTDIQDMKFTEDKLEMSRNFANKIWNASRFILSLCDEMPPKPDELSDSSKWIISSTNRITDSVTRSLGEYQFGEACQNLYSFFWSDLCDWYLEIAKEEINDPALANSTKWTLLTVLSASMRLLHPFMPFISEEIWQKLPSADGSVCVAGWPESEDYPYHDQSVYAFGLAREMITDIRRLRSDMQVPLGSQVPAHISVHTEADIELVEKFAAVIKRLAKISELTVGKDIPKPPKSVSESKPKYEIYVILEGFDASETINRLQKRINEADGEIKRLEGKLSNEQFVSKAPQNVVDKEKEKLEAVQLEKQKLAKQLQVIT